MFRVYINRPLRKEQWHRSVCKYETIKTSRSE